MKLLPLAPEDSSNIGESSFYTPEDDPSSRTQFHACFVLEKLSRRSLTDTETRV